MRCSEITRKVPQRERRSPAKAARGKDVAPLPASRSPGFISPSDARYVAARAKHQIQRKHTRLLIPAAYYRGQLGICFHSKLPDARNAAAAYDRLLCFLLRRETYLQSPLPAEHFTEHLLHLPQPQPRVPEAALIQRGCPGADPWPSAGPLRRLARKKRRAGETARTCRLKTALCSRRARRCACAKGGNRLLWLYKCNFL